MPKSKRNSARKLKSTRQPPPDNHPPSLSSRNTAEQTVPGGEAKNPNATLRAAMNAARERLYASQQRVLTLETERADTEEQYFEHKSEGEAIQRAWLAICQEEKIACKVQQHDINAFMELTAEYAGNEWPQRCDEWFKQVDSYVLDMEEQIRTAERAIAHMRVIDMEFSTSDAGNLQIANSIVDIVDTVGRLRGHSQILDCAARRFLTEPMTMASICEMLSVIESEWATYFDERDAGTSNKAVSMATSAQEFFAGRRAVVEHMDELTSALRDWMASLALGVEVFLKKGSA